MKKLAPLLFVLAACAPAYRGEPIVGPLDTADPRVALGEQVFAANCNQCHPGGSGGLGLSLNDKPLPGWIIKYQVRNGLGAMPAFSATRLDEHELDALVTYLVRLRKESSKNDPD